MSVGKKHTAEQIIGKLREAEIAIGLLSKTCTKCYEGFTLIGDLYYEYETPSSSFA